MKKIVNGSEIDLNDNEIIAEEERIAEAEAAAPMQAWLQKMAESDKKLPRWAEDLFDLVTGVKSIEELTELSALVTSKKALRSNTGHETI